MIGECAAASTRWWCKIDQYAVARPFVDYRVM